MTCQPEQVTFSGRPRIIPDMEQFKISTLSEQFPNQLAQGKEGKVILAGQGDDWFLENLFTTEGGDNRAIIAPRLGMLQALAGLAPVFKPGCSDLSGEVRLSLEDERFPWRFDNEDSNGFTVTAREQSIPDGVVLPAGGKIFLVWEATEVKWVWSGGVVPAIPGNARWVLQKVEPVNHDLEQVKISLFTKEFALPRERFVAQADGSVVLTAEGDKWFLRSSSKEDDSVKSKTSSILAPSLGLLQVLAQLAPIFPPKTKSEFSPAPKTGGHGEQHVPSCDDVVDQRGELGLSVATNGNDFPWTFEERAEGGVTITATAPPELTFPAGGRVYLVWELPNMVKWQFSGGLVEEVPPGALWAVSPVDGGGGGGGGKEGACGVAEHVAAAAGSSTTIADTSSSLDP
ncbi:unnamed protein product [Ectocarpus sp. 12 AP-2014]